MPALVDEPSAGSTGSSNDASGFGSFATECRLGVQHDLALAESGSFMRIIRKGGFVK
jgi:hypothetical protein